MISSSSLIVRSLLLDRLLHVCTSDIWVLPIGTRFFKQFDVDGAAIETRMIQRGQRFLMGMVHDAATLGHKRMEDFEKRGLSLSVLLLRPLTGKS